MATNNKALTAEQLEAHKSAVEMYILAQYKANKSKLGTVVILPTFVQDAEGAWIPDTEGMVRASKGDMNFIHLGSIVLGEGLKPTPRYTNSFQADSKLNTLLELWDMIDDTMKGKLVVEESLEPFSTKNPDRDIKWANQSADIPCMLDDQPIYRRTVHTSDMSRTDTLIQHTNREQIRESYAVSQKANTSTLTNAGKRIAGRVK
jgi:hypothetical protein